MSDSPDPGGILTPKQREFLRGRGGGTEMSEASKRMTRKRIAERIRVSIIKDMPLIEQALATEHKSNSISAEKVVDFTNLKGFYDGLRIQVALVQHFSEASGGDVDQFIEEGLERGLKTREKKLYSKAHDDPLSITLAELKELHKSKLEEQDEEAENNEETWEEIIERVVDDENLK